MKYILAVDFGSTFTKVTAIDLAEKKILGTAKAFTTITTDVSIGLSEAKKRLFDHIGHVSFEDMVACSSAAGGLKMVSVGLVPSLTSKAAKLAATSAGAKVIKTYSYELSPEEQAEILEIKPDILLLSGGTDGGNKEVILKNAKQLADIPCFFSVIVAGNKSATNDVVEILRKGNKNAIPCKNVMPQFDVLDITPAQNAIRDLFIDRIIEAKGLGKIQQTMATKIMPTPLAVFHATALFAKGTTLHNGWGDLMAVDVGGATTDVYSMCDGRPTMSNVVEKGLKEPFAKRTVEGDLGVRYNIGSIASVNGVEAIAETVGTEVAKVEEWIACCEQNPDIIAEKDTVYKKIEDALCGVAVETAMERHCGTIEKVFTPFGETFLQNGKDLTEVQYMIGLGGPIIHSADPMAVLSSGLYRASHYERLLPKNPKMLLDQKYIFSAMGLLSQLNEDIAMEMMKKEIVCLS